MSVAHQALEKLLRRAENSHVKELARTISLLFTQESFPHYWEIDTNEKRQACHGELLLAERAGAITVHWDRRAGTNNQVEKIVLKEPTALARHLNITPRWEAVASGEKLLNEFVGQYPVLHELISLWSIGKKPRGTSAADVGDWLDAIRVIEFCKHSDTLDIPVRRASATLTFDSKRIETLWDIIDVLLMNDMRTVTRTAEEVFAEIGLVKYPPTLLISGNVTVRLCDADLVATRPYIGLPPAAINGFVIGESPVNLLTVENLTTFHEMATIIDQPNRLLLYTGGMPSPSWVRVYNMLLWALPARSRIFHWGDIDTGGFRIANHIAGCCERCGKILELHVMHLEGTPSTLLPVRRELTAKEVTEIGKICERWGWSAQQEWVSKNHVAIEQESLPAIWP